MKKRFSKPVCPYCDKESVLTDGKEIYPHRPDLYSLRFWLCRDCEAYVGCHKAQKGRGDGTRPLGGLANRKLRILRQMAHRHFDHLWKVGPLTRKSAYQILANSMEMQTSDCHISHMNELQCEKVIRLCKRHTFTKGK